MQLKAYGSASKEQNTTKSANERQQQSARCNSSNTEASYIALSLIILLWIHEKTSLHCCLSNTWLWTRCYHELLFYHISVIFNDEKVWLHTLAKILKIFSGDWLNSLSLAPIA